MTASRETHMAPNKRSRSDPLEPHLLKHAKTTQVEEVRVEHRTGPKQELLNHNGKPYHLLLEQTYAPNAKNYVGGNLTPDQLVRCLRPGNIRPIASIVISVLMFNVNGPGDFQMFLRDNIATSPYDFKAPEVSIRLPIGNNEAQGYETEGIGYPEATIGRWAHTGAEVTGAKKIAEMDCVLLPVTFGRSTLRLRVIAMFKSVDEQADLLSSPHADGYWLSEEEVENKDLLLAGGLIMKREIARGFQILRNAAKDPNGALDCSEALSDQLVGQQLKSDGLNEEWLPSLGPVVFLA